MSPRSKADGFDVGDGFVLPAQTVTETLAFLGKRGSGKSSAAVRLAEQMWDRGHQWVAIDPKGDWHGIRSSADGKTKGLPVPIFGGRHGDLPLDKEAGALIAQLVIDRDLTVVLDVSLFSKADQIRFVTDFAEALFRHIGDDPRPLHLFLEEAEEVLPQRVDARAARMVGAYSKIAKQGRTFGLGVSLITQRSASLNKDALSQTDTLVLFRTTSPHDRKAVVAWAEYHGESKSIAESLSALSPGESWVLSPGFLGEIRKVTWHRRRTFDSGATPVTGKGRRTEPVSLADIDLGEISDLMAETIERAAESDPKALRKKIRALEAELARERKAKPAPETIVETVEVEVVPDWVHEIVADAVRTVEQFGTDLSSLTDAALDSHRDLLAKQVEIGTFTKGSTRSPIKAPTPTRPRSARSKSERNPPMSERSAGRPPAPGRVHDDDDVKLGKRERSILTVLAQHPDGRTHRQIALLTGYSPKSSTISAGLSQLRKHGFVTSGGNTVRATPSGIEALGDFEMLPTGPALFTYWMGQLGQRERVFLDALVAAYPDPLELVELAEAGGYSPDSSTVSAGMSKLRGLGLADGWAAADDFMEAIT